MGTTVYFLWVNAIVHVNKLLGFEGGIAQCKSLTVGRSESPDLHCGQHDALRLLPTSSIYPDSNTNANTSEAKFSHTWFAFSCHFRGDRRQ